MDPLAIVKKASSQRAGLLSVGTISSPNTTLPGNVAVVGSLSVAGEITNNVTGALSLRVFDDTGLYALRTLTAGNPLPTPLSSKPLLEQQISSLNLTNATFGTVSAGYSLKINGYVQPPATGTYLFRTTYRDGVSLYIATRKLVDSWTYQGSIQQSVGTLTMYQNVWYNFAIEHAAASSAERLLVEWSNPGGTYTTLQHSTGTFTFAYDMKEIPGSLMGTSYVYGRANFADVANLSAGAILPNASFFSGNTSELNNDVGYLKSGFSSLSGTSLTISGTVTAGALAFAGTVAGTLLQFNNVVSTISGTVTTTAYGAFGVSPGTALDRYALNAHRWWTGSSGTTSGTVGMVLNSVGLSITGTTSLQNTLFGATTQASTATASVILSGGGLLISNPTNATSVSGNALHVTGGVNIAMDTYIGSNLNARAITPSSAVYFHANGVSLSTSAGPYGYTYSTSTVWSLFKSLGSDAAGLLRTSGLFVAQTKALYTIYWAGYAVTAASYFIQPITSTYYFTGATSNNVCYIPQVIVSANSVFSASLVLPMAVGDFFALSSGTSGSTVQSCSVSITAQPLGAF